MTHFKNLCILLLLAPHGAAAQAQDSAASPAATVTCYDVKADADSLKALGETMPTFLGWFEEKDKCFDGDTGTYFPEMGNFSNRTPALSHSSLGYAYQSPRVKHCGPTYKKQTIVWFANGLFDEITGCTDKVRFHESIDTYRRAGYSINADLGKVKTVEIVEGDTTFRARIPHLMSWAGDTPVLIYVTYEGESRLK